jgi:hypothetical protein
MFKKEPQLLGRREIFFEPMTLSSVPNKMTGDKLTKEILLS